MTFRPDRNAPCPPPAPDNKFPPPTIEQALAWLRDHLSRREGRLFWKAMSFPWARDVSVYSTAKFGHVLMIGTTDVAEAGRWIEANGREWMGYPVMSIGVAGDDRSAATRAARTFKECP